MPRLSTRAKNSHKRERESRQLLWREKGAWTSLPGVSTLYYREVSHTYCDNNNVLQLSPAIRYTTCTTINARFRASTPENLLHDIYSPSHTHAQCYIHYVPDNCAVGLSCYFSQPSQPCGAKLSLSLSRVATKAPVSTERVSRAEGFASKNSRQLGGRRLFATTTTTTIVTAQLLYYCYCHHANSRRLVTVCRYYGFKLIFALTMMVIFLRVTLKNPIRVERTCFSDRYS